MCEKSSSLKVWSCIFSPPLTISPSEKFTLQVVQWSGRKRGAGGPVGPVYRGNDVRCNYCLHAERFELSMCCLLRGKMALLCLSSLSCFPCFHSFFAPMFLCTRCTSSILPSVRSHDKLNVKIFVNLCESFNLQLACFSFIIYNKLINAVLLQ